MLHPQCGDDTALAWRDYPICGENGGTRGFAVRLTESGWRSKRPNRHRMAQYQPTFRRPETD